MAGNSSAEVCDFLEAFFVFLFFFLNVVGCRCCLLDNDLSETYYYYYYHFLLFLLKTRFNE